MESISKETKSKTTVTGRGHGGRGRGRGSSSDMSSQQQLRQRRFQILKDKAHEAQEEKVWREASEHGMKQRKYYMTKLAMVVVTAAVVSVVAILHHRRPSFLFHRTKAPPPLYMATRYPHDVVVERDLPRFFQAYTIATPQNKHARKAVIHVANSRNALKYATGNLKVLLKAWDGSNVNQLLERNICGRNFEKAYRASTFQRQDDLLMWCLLTTRIVEGFFLGSVEMIGNAFVLAKQRGMIVLQRGETRKHMKENDDEEEALESRDNGRISHAYYLHPRLQGEESFTAALPSMVLDWLLGHPENTLTDPIVSLQETIYRFLKSENMEDRYMILEEICQDIEPDRAIGKQCSADLERRCCYFVVPDAEGGHPITSKDAVIASGQRSLRDEFTGATRA